LVARNPECLKSIDHETADSAAKNDGIKVFGIARRVTTSSGHLVAHEFHVSGSR